MTRWSQAPPAQSDGSVADAGQVRLVDRVALPPAGDMMRWCHETPAACDFM